MKRRLASFVIVVLPLFVSLTTQVQAVELLINGGFEAPITLSGFTLSEFRTGSPVTPFDTAEIVGHANQPMAIPGERGLNNKPWGAFSMSADRLNSVLSQTVPGVAGETYKYSGWSWWEFNYSGFVTFLDPSSPSDPGGAGTVPSPTETTMELAFLNASNVVLGSVTRDLRTENFGNEIWTQHELMGVAPLGTTQVRVTASMLDGVWNTDPGQAAKFDNFSLTRTSAPGTELLTNANLNAPESIPGFTITEVGGESAEIVSGPGFPPRATGTKTVFLKAYNGNFPTEANPDASPVDAILTQMVPAMEGGAYTFTGWSRWESGYSGGVEFLDPSSPNDPGGTGTVPSPTETTMELAFLNGFGTVLGTPVTLDLRTEQMNDNTWREHELMGTAPAGAVSVRVTASMLDGVFNVDNPFQGSFFDDFSLMLASVPGVPGDYNGNGTVDAADYTVWRDGGPLQNEVAGVTPGSVTPEDYDAWKARFGNTSGAGSSAFQAVPEPGCCVLAIIAILLGAGPGRRRLTIL